MHEPGERRPPGVTTPPSNRRRGDGWPERLRPRSLGGAIILAMVAAVLAALGWALLRGILEVTAGLLAIAAIGGWGIGAAIRRVRSAPLLAALLGSGTWVLALLLTWVVTKATLQGSSQTFLERLTYQPFLDWLSPQFGLLDVAGLALFAGTAAFAARPSASPEGGRQPRP